MALPVPLPGYKFRLLMGDGATPTEAFTFICTANTVKVAQKLNTDEQFLSDCTSPDLLPQRVIIPTGDQWDITFSGICDALRFQTLQTAYKAGVAKNWQLLMSGTAADGGGQWQGSALMTQLDLGKSNNGLPTFDSTLNGTGPWTWTAASA